VVMTRNGIATTAGRPGLGAAISSESVRTKCIVGVQTIHFLVSASHRMLFYLAARYCLYYSVVPIASSARRRYDGSTKLSETLIKLQGCTHFVDVYAVTEKILARVEIYIFICVSMYICHYYRGV
jgi:hypothetical protein